MPSGVMPLATIQFSIFSLTVGLPAEAPGLVGFLPVSTTVKYFSLEKIVSPSASILKPRLFFILPVVSIGPRPVAFSVSRFVRMPKIVRSAKSVSIEVTRLLSMVLIG